LCLSWFKNFICFVHCASFRIIDGTSFMAKDEDGHSVQKLKEAHVSTFKKLARVLCLIKNKNKK